MKGMAGSTDSSKEIESEEWIRPETLAEFVGQPKLRERLGVALQAAKARSETLDHVLFLDRQDSVKRLLPPSLPARWADAFTRQAHLR